MSDEAIRRWRELNRANWDERAAVHVGPGSNYDLASLRAGRARLHPIEDAELGDVAGLRVLHLQCHIGTDTLALAQRGARVVGLDFSPAAIDAARALASELGLAGRARFVLADLYDAPTAIPEPQSFDRVFTTLGRHLLAARREALGSDHRLVPEARRPSLLCGRPSRGLRLRRRSEAP